MLDLILAVSIITLNVNGLNTPIKRQRLSATEADLKYKMVKSITTQTISRRLEGLH